MAKNISKPARRKSGSRDATVTVIVGLGSTGLSCARYLARHGDVVRVTDSRPAPPGLAALRDALPQVDVRVGGFDTGLLEGADRVVVSPGVALTDPFVLTARNAGLQVLGDIDLFAAAARAPVLGITGSNGKSTVTAMLAEMLTTAGCQVAAGANLGVPALDLLCAEEPDYYVLELSSFQLERTESLHCDVAVVLNLTPDHLDRHLEMGQYAVAKARIYEGCRVAVFNRDDNPVGAFPGAAATISFGSDSPAPGQFGLRTLNGQVHLAFGEQFLLQADELGVAGTHNQLNALAALAIAYAAGMSLPAVIPGLRDFSGLPHRMQSVTRSEGVTWINDSKGTNVGAAVAAIGGVQGSLVWIGGGDGKGADFAALAPALRDRARVAILLGHDAPRIENVLQDVCPVRRVASMREAVAVAAQLAKRGDTVLLSPACASLDMYQDFAARGDDFTRAVLELTR